MNGVAAAAAAAAVQLRWRLQLTISMVVIAVPQAAEYEHCVVAQAGRYVEWCSVCGYDGFHTATAAAAVALGLPLLRWWRRRRQLGISIVVTAVPEAAEHEQRGAFEASRDAATSTGVYAGPAVCCWSS
jgi:hypothetical protein